MILEELVIHNFQSIIEATVYLNDRGLVAVRGVNLDGNGANSNGSGKSTLINAILWCNYGDPGKKAKSKDDVVNTTAKKNCAVSCYWLDEDNNTRYVINRYRKHKTHKNSLLVYRIDGDDFINISKGTDEATQVLVNTILGNDKNTFEADCFARQKDAPEIPAMTDTELKNLLEKVLPFEDLSALYKEASREVGEFGKVIEATKRELWLAETQHRHFESDVEAAKESIANWDGEQLERKADIKRDIVLYQQEVADETAKLKPADKVTAAIEKYQLIIDGWNAVEYGQVRAKRAQLANEEFTASIKVRDYLKYAECDSCGQSIADPEATLKAFEAAHSDLKRKLGLAESEMEKWEAKEDAYKLAKTTLDRLILLERTQERMQRNIDRAKDNISRLERELAQELPCPHHDRLKLCMGRYEENKADIVRLRERQVAEERELAILEGVAETYSPTGLRYHMLETITPELNRETNYYLSQLTDGTFKAIWSTVTKLKSGEYREKFSIDVSGGEAPSYGLLSGGEQRKVRLACFFGLQEVIASRATKSIKLWCADEIDYALDEAGLERLMVLLHEKAQKKSTILVISHNELSEWIPNSAIVTKSGGISEITGILSEK